MDAEHDVDRDQQTQVPLRRREIFPRATRFEDCRAVRHRGLAAVDGGPLAIG